MASALPHEIANARTSGQPRLNAVTRSNTVQALRIPLPIRSAFHLNNLMLTVDQLILSATQDPAPPSGLSEELTALWHTKAGHWEMAHDIAQEIHTPMGSWLHALLHLIEGDTGNAGYWFRQAQRPIKSMSEIDELWQEIAVELLQ